MTNLMSVSLKYNSNKIFIVLPYKSVDIYLKVYMLVEEIIYKKNVFSLKYSCSQSINQSFYCNQKRNKRVYKYISLRIINHSFVVALKF